MEFEKDASFWKSIVDKMLAGVCITDITMKHLYVNDIFSAVTGYSKEELKKMHLTELAHKDYLQVANEIIERVLNGENVAGEFMYVTKLGEVRWVFGIFRPMFYKGKAYAIGNYIDITHTKELERKLKENEELYRSLIENSASPIYIVQDRKFVFLNRRVEELTKYSREELIGSDAFRIVYSADREIFLKKYLEIEKGLRGVETHTFRVVAKDGRIGWFTTNAMQMEYKGRPAVYVSGIETTELVNLNEELRKKNEFFSLLSKIMRHDIMNDLAVVRASIEIRSEDMLEKALQRIDSIVEKINDIKLLEEAIGALKVLNVAEKVEKVVEKYRNEANFKLELESVYVEANEALKSVIDNLINNAIQHSQVSQLEIEVKVFRDGKDCVLRIADNGVGIADEIKERIFESRYSRKGGGLGLFLVKKIVEMFKGRIAVYDNKPSGAVFEIRIPIKE